MIKRRKVAIVGCAYRFPGSSNAGFWQNLMEGRDLVTQVDPSRWNKREFLHPDKASPASSYTFASGTLGDISAFDAGFFSISPREAAMMDPQQRMLLEMCWETFENAGVSRPACVAATAACTWASPVSSSPTACSRTCRPSMAPRRPATP
ncbi:beta-ketoacyl synthase N-terminal-like domain-containing protein [Pseudomonas sp. 13.2]|uniref:Beta-ketoacyl synthase N-terminal-like domain-containing protein n=1 Tax=Pseudomonas sp. 13.2 TaxID=3144665 RepID=A0AAU7BJY7_9PSED